MYIYIKSNEKRKRVSMGSKLCYSFLSLLLFEDLLFLQRKVIVAASPRRARMTTVIGKINRTSAYRGMPAPMPCLDSSGGGASVNCQF